MTNQDVLINVDQVAAIIGNGESTIWEWIREDRHKHLGFPRPIKKSARCTRWYKSEVLDWMKHRPRG